MTEATPTKCAGITKTGKRCPRGPLPGSRYCLAHDPDAAELRRQGAIKGGRNRSNEARAMRHVAAETMTPAEVAAVLSGVLRGVVAGTVEPKAATAAATVGKVLIDLHNDAERAELAEIAESLMAEKRRIGSTA